jgi:release factor glutamine methyltransferase
MERSEIVARLWTAGCVFASEEAEVLLSSATSPRELESMVAKRVAGAPLEHIVGWVEFCGRRVEVDLGVFVPRRRTEFLARKAVEVTPAGAVVLDMCCGSGAVAAAVLGKVPAAEVHAVDIDAAAVKCARRNLPLSHVYQGDLYEPLPLSLRGRVRTLTANAPYVPSGAIGTMPPEARDYEPRVALDGGDDGLEIHRRLIAGASAWLAPGGYLIIETSEGQAPLAMEALGRNGFTAAVETCDELDATIVTGRRH